MGYKEIEAIMRYIEILGIEIPKRRALDFGCGVGRLTQALANYFDEVVGVDVAPSMLELAVKYNRYPDKCKYILNETDDLKIFSNCYFDFIYTNITLQHISPRYSKKYIREMIRILDPGGVLIFQLPSERTKIGILKLIIKSALPFGLYKLYRKLRWGTDAVMEMHGIEKDQVVHLLTHEKVKIIDVKEDSSAGKEWRSYRYYCMKEKF